MITPIILAAGASTRMGRPKALLEFNGRTALALVLDAVRELDEPVVVLGHEAETLRPHVTRGRAVTNADWARGQTSSLKAGLRAAPGSEAYLMHPVDTPLIRVEDVRALVASRQGDPRAGRVWIPSHRMRRGHPVLFDAPVAEELLRLDDASPARGILEAAGIVHVETESPYVLMDMDTPDDYARLLSEYRRRR
jgi:molybdenum cofactor cytidylyltransferase